jgi:ubiquinone/menaquinone biosynthesis C-methylase UbiE
MTINVEQLRGFISAMYSDVARFPRGEFHFPTGRPIMERLGYEQALLDHIPEGAMASYAGVGHHFGLDPLKPGEHVLDLGSGSGSDIFHAALQVGSSGRAVGIDMTDQMLDKARKLTEQFEIDNVEFVKGYIEELPFEDESFDCVISNGVINLAVEKPGIFEGVKRVLKPGGRMMFSDIVTGVELPASVRENCELWAECIGGAFEQQDYLKLVTDAGLRLETHCINDEYKFTQESTINAADKFQVRSVSILAYKAA